MKRQKTRWYRLPGRLFRRSLPRRIRRMLPVPLGIVVVGTVAYPLIEGPPWTLFDGLYMTVITLTTIGYGEIPSRSPDRGASSRCSSRSGAFSYSSTSPRT